MNKRQVIYLLKKYKELVLLGSISLIAFIIGGLVIGWILSLVIIGAIDLLLFFPNKDQWLKKDKGGKNVKIDNYTQNTRSARSANAKTANKKTKKKKNKKKKWKKPRPRQESLRECLARAAEELELSASTVLDIPELECSPREVLLERHHGVLEYTDERIRVAARDVTVEIRGMDLRLGAMSQGALHIRGQVAAVEFIRS